MNIKKYIVIFTMALMMAISYVGSATAGPGGCGGGNPPPPDTNSISIESPAS